MTTFSPREIVSELDRYIVGQTEAKRAVAIALRIPTKPTLRFTRETGGFTL